VRKFFSILFIVLILLNVMGYYGLFLGLHYRNSQMMIQRLDSNSYNKSETITLKIPIAVPYVFDSPSFERVNGQFQYKGEFYRLVKQRLSSDTLHVICVRDVESRNIQRALTSYVETFTDKPIDNSSNTKTFFDVCKDYVSHDFSMAQLSLGLGIDVVRQTSLLNISSTFCSSVIHPPERKFSI
jgi:hypothetical protein